MNAGSMSPSTSGSPVEEHIPPTGETTPPQQYDSESEAPTSVDELFQLQDAPLSPPPGSQQLGWQDLPNVGTSSLSPLDHTMPGTLEPEEAADTSEPPPPYEDNYLAYERQLELCKFGLALARLSPPPGWKAYSYRLEGPHFDIDRRYTFTVTGCYVEVHGCKDYVSQAFGPTARELLDVIDSVMHNPWTTYASDIIRFIATPEESTTITVVLSQDIPGFHPMMMWLCSVFREPIPGTVSLSYCKARDGYAFEPAPLRPVPIRSSLYRCCTALFGYPVVIAASPTTSYTQEFGLDVDIPFLKSRLANRNLHISVLNTTDDEELYCSLEMVSLWAHISAPAVERNWGRSKRARIHYCPCCMIEGCWCPLCRDTWNLEQFTV